MTVTYALELDERSTPPSEMWRQRPAREVRAGWTLQLDDGRTVTVLADPIPLRLGKVAVPIETPAHWSVPDLPPEYVPVPGFRLVACRTPLEEAAYQNAVNDMAAISAARRGQ